MKILSENELLKLKESISFFDFDEFEISDKKFIKYELEMDPIKDYPDIIFRMKYLSKTIVDTIKKYSNEVVIYNHDDRWLTQEDECLPLRKTFFKNLKLTNDFKGGLKVDATDDLLTQFIDSAFRYNSFIGIIVGDLPIIISPTDHLDVFVYTSNQDISQSIVAMINNSEYAVAEVIEY